MLENNLRKVRQRRGYSQTNLTQKTGISSSTISAIENRKLYPHPGWRKKFAAVLETTEAELFPGVVKHDADSKDKITPPVGMISLEGKRQGILPAVRLGRHIRVDREVLDEWIKNGGQSLPGGWKREGGE